MNLTYLIFLVFKDVRKFYAQLHIISIRIYLSKHYLDKILKATTKLQIRNLGLYIQNKEGELVLSGVESSV